MKSIFVDRTDTEVIQACLDHGLGAWEELVRRYRRLVYSIPLKFHLSHDDAMEIAQSVWTDCFEQLASLRSANHLQAWLVRITVRKCCRFIERARNRREVALEAGMEKDPAWTTNPYPELIRQLHEQQLIQTAIEQLSKRCQQIVLALFYEDPTPTYALLAQRLNLSINSIGYTRDRCLNCLAKILVGLGYGG